MHPYYLHFLHLITTLSSVNHRKAVTFLHHMQVLSILVLKIAVEELEIASLKYPKHGSKYRISGSYLMGSFHIE